ncbi:protein translocase subunit SecF [Acetivibrio cellulolyticus]|uniref:protein translocase subunit SecF n=1 Tax=Acetivibrio cellulolyticus TaxID=35830 RepID=UPI0001E2E6DD|nr:protein translocase subunit SecF [Acetivibrio cellulolyticus]
MFDFIANKKYFFCFSGLIFLVGIIALIIHGGFNLDIQFQGGTILEIQMADSNFDIAKAADVAKTATGKVVSAQHSYTLDASNKNTRIDLLVLSVSSKDKLSDGERDELVNAISKEFKVKEGARIEERSVGASMSKELAGKSMWAVILACILMLIYVWIRFNAMNGLLAGFASIVALVHDVGVMLTLYAVLDIPCNESFIAAILTILGYSLNDTIVIFDRIRENSSLLRKESLASLTNKSIWQTMSRTLCTAATTGMCVIIIFIFAWYNKIDSIMEFILPLLVGMISGVYSTIFIASPVWVMCKEWQAKRKLAAKPAKA